MIKLQYKMMIKIYAYRFVSHYLESPLLPFKVSTVIKYKIANIDKLALRRMVQRAADMISDYCMKNKQLICIF